MDWTRHISPAAHSDRSIMLALVLRRLFGLGGPFIVGHVQSPVWLLLPPELTDGDMVGG
ncbi:hypothetical protein [Nocardia spumae]|uniref:hypothetical protein n=1 Tax=Nocardia spumae TaxID=2887190 RepID=UPI001D132A78|nr:hypothetical protein [Nocardia spumae]